jgi:two-component system, cell cycle sensor histidine kinase and response regulator CckA
LVAFRKFYVHRRSIWQDNEQAHLLTSEGKANLTIQNFNRKKKNNHLKDRKRIRLLNESATIKPLATKQAEKRAEKIKGLKKQMEFILGVTKTGLDIIDSEFNVRYIDPEWVKLYGNPTGKKCYEYFMDRSEVCPHCGIPTAFKTKAVTVTEEILVMEGNRPIQVTTIPFQNEKGEWLVAEVNVDISDRKRAEDALRKAHEELETQVEERTGELAKINETLNGEIVERKRAEERLEKLSDCLLSFESNPDKNINRLVALCGKQLHATCALYNRLKEGMLQSVGQWNTPPDYLSIDKPDGHICYDLIQGGKDEVRLIRNLPTTIYAKTDPNVLCYSLKSYMGKPVFFENTPVGSLCVVYQEDYVPSEEDKRLLAIIASAIGVEEKRKRAEEGLQESEEAANDLAQENAIMAEIGRIISSTLNIEEIYERFAGEVRKLISFDRIAIRTINPKDNTATIAYISGVDVENHRFGDTTLLSGSVAEECIRTQSSLLFQPENVDEVTNRFPNLLPTLKAGLQSMMFVPLISKDQVIGVLSLQATEPKAYTGGDLRLAERVGDQIAGAVANAQLFMQLKRTEEALRESERKFRDLYDNAPLGYHEYDKEGRITKVNQTDLEMLGYTAEELIGQPIWKLNVGEEIVSEQVLAKLAGTLPPGRNLERTYKRKDGTAFPVLIQDRLILDEKGRIKGIRCTTQDITGIKQAEESLRRSEERAKRIAQENLVMAEIGRIISSTLNIDDVYERFAERVGNLIPFDRISISIVNPEKITATMTYVTGVEVVGRRFGDIVPVAGGTIAEECMRTQSGFLLQPESADEAINRFPTLLPTLEAGLRSMIFVPLISKDEVIGILHLLSTQPKAYSGTDVRLAERVGNQIAGAIANAQLFMERKRAEKALRESEERYRTLAESAQDSIFILDREGRTQYINHFGAVQIGVRPEEIVGKTLTQIFPAEVADNQMLALQTVFKSGKPFFHEIKIGKEIWTDVRLIPILAQSGQVQSVMGIARDITERKRADEALRKSEDKLQKLFNEAPVGYMELDAEGCITQVNLTELTMLGYTADEMLGQHVWKFIVEEEEAEARQAIEAKLSGSTPCGKTIERTYKRKDGTPLPVMIEDVFIRDASERITGIHATIRDITERKRAEKEMADLQEQLRQSQKMEAIGQLAGGVSHDFNNLLTVIKGYCQLALLDLKENDPLWENIQEIQKAAQRAADLTRQLLAFSRRQILDLKVLDLNSLLKDTDKMLRRIIGEDIELAVLSSEDLGRVKIDSSQIEQVVFNLAVNARDAMPSGGRFTIETANVELDEEYARAHIGVIPGHYVRLSVSDTGVGMSPEVKEKVFEPFFTTKDKGKGTGLGLSTVYGIVNQSKGNIWIYSEPGHGTTFKIHLPRVEGALDALHERDETDSFPKGSETVLLVEDEPSVRDLANRLLRKQGYRVLEAPNGGEALRIVRENNGEKIHLLLTDVVLPQMGGKELADKLKILRPDIKVLYTSGYTDYAIVHHGVLDSGTHFLQKPFSLKTLSHKVREALDR